MEIEWRVEAKDIEKVRELYELHKNSRLVKYRERHNLSAKKPELAKSRIWRAVAAALLTTQQRSGPDSPVARFIQQKPFPLSYDDLCVHREDVEHVALRALKAFRGIRRTITLAGQLRENLERLEDGLWTQLLAEFNRLRHPHSRQVEIEVADFVDQQLVGFGPKQSRNLLQGLGLTMYEIPLDSRITKWLNELGFPIVLSAAGLADPHYYRFVADGVCQLCESSGIKPCIFDACVFASFDREAWTEENAGW